MNELYDVLKTSKASDFLIREEQTESREAFFIGQKLVCMGWLLSVRI